MKYAHITGWGKYAPERIVTNDDLAKIMDTSDEWVRKMTGIAARRWARKDETLADMAVAAAMSAIDHAGIGINQIDMVIVATATAIFPATACIVQDRLGIPHAGAVDLVVACAGFIYGLSMAGDMVKTGTKNCVLVVGVEKLSALIDTGDRNTAVLFGDGAGAMIVQSSDQPGGILSSVLYADGSGGEDLFVNEKRLIEMNGREVFKFATRAMPSSAKEVMSKVGWRSSQVDLFVPHQANIRIIETAAKGLNIPMDKVFVNIEKYGNTSAASIPIAVCEAVEQGRLRPNDKTIFVGFGAGLAWGAVALIWNVPQPRNKAQRVLNRATYNASKLRSRLRRGARSIGERLLPKPADKSNNH
jgi:3-oxoacyl-[acyl-carrier-protein] synthase-3